MLLDFLNFYQILNTNKRQSKKNSRHQRKQFKIETYLESTRCLLSGMWS